MEISKEEAELQKAIEESKKQAELEAKKRKGGENKDSDQFDDGLDFG